MQIINWTQIIYIKLFYGSKVLKKCREGTMQSGSDETEHINLIFERIDDASVLSNFYCGIKDMDDFIHEKLQNYRQR